MTWMRSQTRHGSSHSHGLRTGMTVSGDIENAGLVELFFGKDGKRQLPLEQFEKFLRDLHKEVTVCPALAIEYALTRLNVLKDVRRRHIEGFKMIY